MNAARGLATLGRAALAFAFPQRCAGCGVEASPGPLCDGCVRRIPRLSFELCVRCLAAEREPIGCVLHRGYGVWAAWLYDERAQILAHALKYGGRPGLARSLAIPLVEALPPGVRPDVVVDVPLHAARRRERGYNQAAVLADAVAERLGAPRLLGALVRPRATREQARLGSRERRANLAGAVRVACPDVLEERKVLLVDDVVTSGATLEACLSALAGCGARATAAALAWAQ